MPKHLSERTGKAILKSETEGREAVPSEGLAPPWGSGASLTSSAGLSASVEFSAVPFVVMLPCFGGGGGLGFFLALRRLKGFLIASVRQLTEVESRVGSS